MNATTAVFVSSSAFFFGGGADESDSSPKNLLKAEVRLGFARLGIEVELEDATGKAGGGVALIAVTA